MILRKPYAFLIKKFKLIHLLLSFIVAYLIYNTSDILKVYNTYISSKQVSDVSNAIGNLSRPLMYVALFVFIVSILIVAIVLKVKKKPILMYIINIIITVAVIGLYSYAYSTLKIIIEASVDVRLVRVLRDLLIIAIALQSVQFILLFVRATGFDIKKFDFGSDLIGLQVTEEGREEVEVSLELDSDVSKRRIIRFFRNFKYTFLENKILFSLFIGIVVLVLFLIILFNILNKQHVYTEGETFTTDNFTGVVNSSYITNKDYNGNVIDEKYSFVVVNISMKSFYNKYTLNYGNMYILINNTKYFANKDYNDFFSDLGKGYKNQDLSSEKYEDYIITFAIPNEVISNTNKLVFDNKKSNSDSKTVIKLKSINFDNDMKIIETNLGDFTKLTDSMYDDGFIQIDTYEISENFKINYVFCVNDECYDSIYTLTPKSFSNYETVILKITGIASGDNQTSATKFGLQSFFENYGYIVYDGKKSKVNMILNTYVKNRISDEELYIEIDKDALNSQNIYLYLTIRNVQYKVKLK